jgi:hypothetical protein
MMTLYISVAPERLTEVRALGRPLLHMAYSFAAPFPEGLEAAGGLMALWGALRAARAPAIIAECRRKGYRGARAGYGYTSRLEAMRLAEALGRRGLRLYLTEEAWCADCGAWCVASTAVSGGSLEGRLKEAAKRCGASRLALDLQRLRHIYPLPSPDGNGRPLGDAEFESLRSAADGPERVSGELCCKYFTVSGEDGPRFVLFDDLETLRLKLELAASLGIREGFVMYPEWDLESLCGL